MCFGACWEQREFKLRERELSGNRKMPKTSVPWERGYSLVMQNQFNCKLGIKTSGIKEGIGSTSDC